MLALMGTNCNDWIVSEQLKPLEYDKERARLFYRRVVRHGNLPYSLRPPEDVDLSAFSDAILGAYEESTAMTHSEGSERHKAHMSRHALAIFYLQGMPLDELSEVAKSIKYIGRTKAETIALDVGSVGARFWKDDYPEHKKSSEQTTYLSESIDEFTDLSDMIRQFYEQKRITAGEASALLLFIAREDSRADPQLKYTAAINIAAQIRIRLRSAMMAQLHEGDTLINQTFERGAQYLQNIINDPVARLNQITPGGPSHSPFTPQNEELQNHQREIDGHVGYVLDQLYR